MFSGIVEELGKVQSFSRRATVHVLAVAAQRILEGTAIGDSIAVNGACLTVTGMGKGWVAFDVMPETARLTNLGKCRIGTPVNLERSLKAGDRISGHFVLGHVDCLGVVRRKGYDRGNLSCEIAVPAHYLKYVLPKGSVCVDGISLTVAAKKASSFAVYIIPHTLTNTTLGRKGASETVNVEFDILAKRPS